MLQANWHRKRTALKNGRKTKDVGKILAEFKEFTLYLYMTCLLTEEFLGLQDGCGIVGSESETPFSEGTNTRNDRIRQSREMG